jgi:hypothetical protein
MSWTGGSATRLLSVALGLLALVLQATLTGCVTHAIYLERLSEADRAYDAGDYRAAIAKYREAKQADPNSVDPSLKLAETYLRLGRSRDALLELTETHKRIDTVLATEPAAQSRRQRTDAAQFSELALRQVNEAAKNVGFVPEGPASVSAAQSPGIGSGIAAGVHPIITVDRATLPAVTTESALLITGTVQGAPDTGIVVVNGIPSRLRRTSGSDALEFVTEVPLRVGDNSIEVALGNTSGQTPVIATSIKRESASMRAGYPSRSALFVVAPRTGNAAMAASSLIESLDLISLLRAGIPADATEALIGPQATRRSILKALEAFAAMPEREQALLYLDIESRLVRIGNDTHVHLVPSDVQAGNIADTSIPVREIMAVLQSHRAKSLVVLLNTEHGAQLLRSSPLAQPRAKSAFISVAAQDRMFVLDDFVDTSLFVSVGASRLREASLANRTLTLSEWISETARQVEAQSRGAQKVQSAGNASVAEQFALQVPDARALYLEAAGELARGGEISRRAAQQINGVLLRGLGDQSSRIAVTSALRKLVRQETTPQELDRALANVELPTE